MHHSGGQLLVLSVLALGNLVDAHTGNHAGKPNHAALHKRVATVYQTITTVATTTTEIPLTVDTVIGETGVYTLIPQQLTVTCLEAPAYYYLETFTSKTIVITKTTKIAASSTSAKATSSSKTASTAFTASTASTTKASSTTSSATSKSTNKTIQVV